MSGMDVDRDEALPHRRNNTTHSLQDKAEDTGMRDATAETAAETSAAETSAAEASAAGLPKVGFTVSS
ncbi:hypothetical protein LPJ59_004916, partial [Coemansia sp. RSA 2399]